MGEHASTRRTAIRAGAIFGGAMTLTISLLMDFMFSGELKGSWRDAIVHDFASLTGVALDPGGIATWALFVLLMIAMAAIGAAIGAAFAAVIHKFLSLLSQ